ncbi:MAG TPA: hypothetical protein VFL79_12205 [Terriglobia bacterium]|nr:hypothetical protein [Terriglobia bacterium]
MSMTNSNAARSLDEIQRAQRRSAAAYSYQKASPHLIVWGVIWVAGYSTTYFRPQANAAVWLILVLLGVTADFWIGLRAATENSHAHGRRFAASLLAAFLFFVALFTIMPPRSGSQVGAIIPIFFGLCYAIAGIWKQGLRFVLLGLAVGVLTVAGYFWLAQFFLLWMAAVGGGALILGGLWLRRV